MFGSIRPSFGAQHYDGELGRARGALGSHNTFQSDMETLGGNA